MSRITATERNFWLNYFRQETQSVIRKYKHTHRQFLQIDIKEQAKTKAHEKLGIIALIESHDQLKKEIEVKNNARHAAQLKLDAKYRVDIEPLEKKRDEFYAKRIAKVMNGNVAGWSKYMSPHRQPFEFEGKLREETANARQELFSTSDIGKHLEKLEQQCRDTPVALMLATSRLEMSNAVRALAAIIGVTLPVTTSLENLTSE